MLEEALRTSLQTTPQLTAIEFSDGTPRRDDELVEAVLAGDDSAFAEIFERYKRPMTRVIGRFFRERAEIEEFVQQCFTKAYFSLKRFRGGEENSLPSWLTRIAVNICYDEFRRRDRKGERLFTEMSDAENDYVSSVADRRSPSDESKLIATQLAARLLAGVDARDRVAMLLVYSDDYSLKEVADAMGITVSNLKSRLFRCRNLLRKRFSHLFD